jgi:HMG (high mobility group) box
MYGYHAFCVANREEVKAANPAAEVGDMGRLLRIRWNSLSESEKAMYDKPQVKDEKDLNIEPEQGVRRSSRLRNKRLGLNFWGLKEKK